METSESCSAGNCSTYHCYVGGPAEPPEGLETGGCPLASHPAQLVDNASCVLCMECLKACPHGSVEFRLRPPFTDIWGGHKPRAAELSLLFMLLGAGAQSGAYPKHSGTLGGLEGLRSMLSIECRAHSSADANACSGWQAWRFVARVLVSQCSAFDTSQALVGLLKQTVNWEGSALPVSSRLALMWHCLQSTCTTCRSCASSLASILQQSLHNFPTSWPPRLCSALQGLLRSRRMQPQHWLPVLLGQRQSSAGGPSWRRDMHTCRLCGEAHLRITCVHS